MNNDVQDNKVFAVLAYFGPLVVIPILAAPNSPFARFHVNQGLILLIVSLCVGFLSGMVAFVPILGGFVSWLVGGVSSLVIFIMAILGIVSAANGEFKELPVIGSIKILK